MGMRIYYKLNIESLMHAKRSHLLRERFFLDSIRITFSNDIFSHSFLHPSLHTLISSFCFTPFVFCPDDSDLTMSNDTNPNTKVWIVLRPNFLNYEQCYDLVISMDYKLRSLIFRSLLYHQHSSTMSGKLLKLFVLLFPYL